MKQKSPRAFTLIELLVSLSILASVSIVAYVSYAGHLKIANNTTRKETIDSLHLSLSDYYEQKKVLPDPNSNYISYDAQGTYMHSLSGAYGISGHVSNDFLPSGYVNFQATDPESDQYYGYGKTLGTLTTDDGYTAPLQFDLAAALYDDTIGGYKTYLRGTYSKERLSSLIRSYSSSNFVSQDSTEELPYNPYERKITAHVSSHSGSIALTDSRWNTLSSTGELNTGDKVTLSTGSTALLHISDGSELSLGSTGSQTELVLSSLAYEGDNNLVSRVALLLNMGEVWTEAPHLRSEAEEASDFSVQTDSAVAAVRGTVFGVAKDPLTSKTAISLASGKIEITSAHNTPFTAGFTPGSLATSTGFILDTTVPSAPKSYMIVPEGGTPLKLDGIGWVTATGTVPSSEIDQKLRHPKFSLGYRPRPQSISFTGMTASTQTGILSVTFRNPGADSYYLSFGTGEIDRSIPFYDTNPFYTGTLVGTGLTTLTGAFSYTPGVSTSKTFALRACFRGRCSEPFIMGLQDTFMTYGPFKVWGEKKKKGALSVIPAPQVCMSPLPTNPSEPRFWTPECLAATSNSWLVAYAPYDNNVDIYGTTGGVLVGTTSSNMSDATYERYDISNNKFYDNSTDESTLSAAYLSGLGFTVSKLSNIAIYWWGNYGTGIFLDNQNPPPDSLQYTLPQDFLTGSFSIEMSVRGAALKRVSGISYTLANGDSGPSSTFRFRLSETWLLFVQNGANSGLSIDHSALINKIPDVNNNAFYKVRYTRLTGNDCKLSIIDSWNNEIISQTQVLAYPPYLSTSNLWIWVWSSSNYQWNDIIDYVKIYR